MNKNKVKAAGLEQEIEKELGQIIPEKEIKNFKAFAFKGHMIELAVAFMVGAAFQKAVESLSSNLLMPFINFFIAKTGTDWRNLTWTPIEGMTIAVGKCMGSLLDFFLIAVILYILYVKIIKNVFEDDQSETIETPSKKCAYCFNKIAVEAIRCPNCTSYV